MSYPDLTATALSGTITVPAGLHPVVARRVATSYVASTMTVTVQGASDSTDTPYPYVTNVVFTNLGAIYQIDVTCRACSPDGVFKIKAENPHDGSYPQFFPVVSNAIQIFNLDGDPSHWTFTPLRIADNLLFTPGWPSTAGLQWSLSNIYGIQEQKAQMLVAYPFDSPAPNYTPRTFVACHVDPSRVMAGTVDANTTLGSARELRVYTFWDLVHDVAIGPPTYCNVPDRRTVALGSQLDGLRQDQIELRTTPFWEDAVGASAAFNFPITVNTAGELDLIRTSDFQIVARASMTNQFPREFFFECPGDTNIINGYPICSANGAAFQEVTFPPYASSVVGLAFLTRASQSTSTAAQVDAAYVNARLIAYGLSQAVSGSGAIGALPFAWGQRTDNSGPSVAYYRTGTEAWGAWYMFTACNKIPASYWTGAYAGWKTTILAAAEATLNWIYTQDPGNGLVRFGTGRTDPSTGVFDPTYQFPFYAMEHQADTLFLYLRAAIDLGDPTWHARAVTMGAQIVAHFWNATDGRLAEAVDASLNPFSTSVLDCYSWGGKALLAIGQSAKARQAMLRADANYQFTNVADDGASVTAYTSYAAADNIVDPLPSIWFEGSCGIWAAKKALGVFSPADQARYANAQHLQQPDGSFRNFQINGGFGDTQDFRSGQATAWDTIVNDPSLWWQETT